MTHQSHSELISFIWNVANKLRGPYRPPQYRKVMLPLIVLRRMDCVLEATKEQVLEKYEELKKDKKLKDDAIHKVLAKKAVGKRQQPLYNISKYTFNKLLGDSDNIARNLVSYIKGFVEIPRNVTTLFRCNVTTKS